MSHKVKVVLNRAGVGELLKSQELSDYLGEIASAKAATLGEGYGSDTYNAGSRVIASVYAATEEAFFDNLNHNTLLKVTGA